MDPDTYPGLTALDTRKTVFGPDRRVVLTHSPNLHAKQSRGFDQTLTKAGRRLTELAATLARGKTRRDREAVLAEIVKITRARWVNRVLTTSLTGDTPAQMRLSFTINKAARKALETELFGKRLPVTDHDNWTLTKIVAGYRSQNVESGSGNSKTRTSSGSPQCSTGPTARSECTSSTASWPWPSRT